MYFRVVLKHTVLKLLLIFKIGFEKIITLKAKTSSVVHKNVLNNKDT